MLPTNFRVTLACYVCYCNTPPHHMVHIHTNNVVCILRQYQPRWPFNLLSKIRGSQSKIKFPQPHFTFGKLKNPACIHSPFYSIQFWKLKVDNFPPTEPPLDHMVCQWLVVTLIIHMPGINFKRAKIFLRTISVSNQSQVQV